MKITVVIPGWNQELFLIDAIESVLEQRLDPEHAIEPIVVVDEDPGDHCYEVAERYLPRVKIVRLKKSGAASSRNFGMKHASGDFFAFLDSDDFWHPDKLQKQLDYLLRNPETGAAFSHELGFEGTPPRSILIASLPDPAAIRPAVNGSSILSRAEIWDLAGPLDETLPVGEFIDWFGRAELAGVRAHTLQDLLVYRRSHDANASRLHEDRKTDYLKTLQRHLKRKREDVAQ